MSQVLGFGPTPILYRVLGQVLTPVLVLISCSSGPDLDVATILGCCPGPGSCSVSDDVLRP